MASAARLLHRLKHCDWLDRQRVFGYSGVLLVLEFLAFLFFVAGTHGWIVPLDKPATTDFVSFYAAGSLADAGTPQLAYDQARHFAAEQQATAPGISYNYFYYPPVFLLVCAVLARLPYLAAFVLFEAATLALYLVVARRILKEPGWWMLVPLVACPAVFWNIGLGQNALLTAALLGGATLAIDRRPIVAGLLFGALCYKPHFGLLVPVALIAGGHWRAFAAATVSVIGLVLVSIALFGWTTWQDYLALAAASPSTYEFGRIDFAGYISLFGGLRLLGTSVAAAYAGQAAASLVAAALVAIIWRRQLSLPIRAAMLAAATTVAVPVILFYDFMILAVAMAWLIRAAREDVFLPWEKAAMLALVPVPLLSRHAAMIWHAPIGPLACLAFLALVFAAARHETARHYVGVRPALLSLPA
jgi:hypothetical protein